MNVLGNLDTNLIAHSAWNTRVSGEIETAAADAGLGAVGAGRVLSAWLSVQGRHVRDVVLGAVRDMAEESDGCDRLELDGHDLEGIARLAGWDAFDLGEVLLEASSFAACDAPGLDELKASLRIGAAALSRAPN